MVKLKLKEYLEERSISLTYIQEKTNIRYATIHAIVNRNVKTLNLQYLQQIMEAINVSDMNVILEVDNNQFADRS